MLFNTVSYLVFLSVAAGLFWAFRPSWRGPLLLVGSIVFYGAWRMEFVLLIGFSAFVDYYFSIRIAETRSSRARRAYMVTSICINLALLAYFKYAFFFLDTMSMAVPISQGLLEASRNIVLPLGISFYTFLSISYTVDVYRRLFEPVRSFPVYLTYVMFWPHMIAGPILRAHELIPQLQGRGRWTAESLAAGFRLLAFGLFLKVVLADQISPLVDDAFASDYRKLGGTDVLTMAFGFGFQIYFDFAGYSLVAIGSARLLGIRFPDNFNWPYLATSPREFWKRWHITLSSWIRDYLYLPLMGRAFRDRSEGGIDIQFARAGHEARAYAALFVTWFIMGLWHGANWKFALWGLWHAAFIAAYRLTEGYLAWMPKSVARVAGWGITLLVAMVGWIPFRAANVDHAVGLLSRLGDPSGYLSLGFRENFYLIVFTILVGMIALKGILRLSETTLSSWPIVLDAGGVVGLTIVLFFVFIFLQPISQFIYFQF